MLSYQHGYHAGNRADLHKHGLLAWMLSYLTRKPKPISYLETHAGRGLYNLDAPEAAKTGEAAQGVDHPAFQNWFVAGHPLIAALDAIRAAHGPRAYPGSPLLASHLLREGDQMTLAELHPQEHAALADALPRFADIKQRDGYETVMSLTPPTPKRGLLLIDPSYEVKDDYRTIPEFIAKLHRKWNVGVIALWYPILRKPAHQGMIDALVAQSLPKVLHHEVTFPPARDGHGMVGSGMFIVNAPHGTAQEAGRLSEALGGAIPQS